MYCYIICPLTGKRRSCYIEYCYGQPFALDGYWVDDGEVLDDDELCMIAELYRDDIRLLAASSRAEEEYDRLRDDRFE